MNGGCDDKEGLPTSASLGLSYSTNNLVVVGEWDGIYANVLFSKNLSSRKFKAREEKVQ
jgi:hypothetical protein